MLGVFEEDMQDKEETTSEASWILVTKGKEKEVWRLKPEGEAARPEATVPWNGVEGVSVNPEGQKSQGRKGKTKQRMEEKVDGKAPGDEGAEIQSPKRKVIRVESEETQDYVRESLNLSRDEAEETTLRRTAGDRLW